MGWPDPSLGKDWRGEKTDRYTGPYSSIGRVSASGNGRSRVRSRPRHTRVLKNGTSCSSLGTQIYGVELELVDPVSG